MRRRIIALTLTLAVGFAVLGVQLTNLGFFAADSLRSHERNTRAAAAALGSARGTINSIDGEILALSVRRQGTDSQLIRTYPHGSLYAHIVGYLGPAAGSAGVERSYDNELSGTKTDIAVRELTDLFADSERVGDLVLTLDHGVQLTARAALGDRDGAVVVLDTTNGAVIAMWSRPSFDPNALTSTASDDYDYREPPAARAYQHHYALSTPGVPAGAGADVLEGARRSMGSTGIDLPGEPARADTDNGAVSSADDEQVLLTPLQLAQAAAAIANGGVGMRPYLVHRIQARSPDRHSDVDPSAAVPALTPPDGIGHLFEPTDAAYLLSRMTAAAQDASISLHPADGEAFSAAIATGRLALATSGTARGGHWAVLLAPADAPTVAAAVLIEPDVGEDRGGATLAAKIAATAAETALGLRADADAGRDRP
ncbi:penicillin-binding transpeptidase domain-containing protein [Candidatus Poriferisodalis sp.]|uniref:penicillin-binding transpeptidase domain-containing protein n=1 Tax=Candidatus Poriferisodalis sp. TaxID=3101277 RepID=UPI003B01037D